MNRKQRRAEKKQGRQARQGASPPVQGMLADALRQHQAGRLNEAERLYREILLVDSSHADSLHLLGVVSYQLSRHDIAVELISKAIATNPKVPEYHSNLGLALKAQGLLEEAVACYRKAVKLKPDYLEAHYNLGNGLKAQGQLEEAAVCYRKAINLKPNYPEAHSNLGSALKDLGRLEDAAACYRKALNLKPDYLEALYNLGTTLQEQGQLEEAAVCYRKVLNLKPDFPEAHNNLGSALSHQGRLEDAVVCYRKALDLKPDYSDALYHLGAALQEQGQLEEAVACYGKALNLKPDFPEAHNNLGNALKGQGRLEEAVSCYRKALNLKPDSVLTLYNLGTTLLERGQSEEAGVYFRNALDLKPDYAECRLAQSIVTLPILVETSPKSAAVTVAFGEALDELIAWGNSRLRTLGKAVGACQPFCLAYRPGNHCTILSRFGNLSSSAAKAYWQDERGFTSKEPPVRDRIRIGVVSAHIRRHSVWDVVLRGIIEGLDNQNFEIFLYHTQPITDDETDWALRRVKRFVQGPKPVAAWLTQIAADQPDILFYPELGMDPITYTLASLRLAPLQVAGWGHPITTGLPTIDLFLSGALLEGEDAEQHYREKLIRLPGTGVCTEPIISNASPVDRALLGLPLDRDVVCFALCHHAFKFDPAYDFLYSRIAKAVGPCQFWLANDKNYSWASEKLLSRLAAAFRSEGLNPDDHLRMIPWLPREKFLGFLDEMDIYLDCPAFSGYTTAWQAAHRGLPIVTLEGAFLRQRLAAGLLRQIELTEGVASTEAEYVEIAVRWAQECRQAERWAARRNAMRQAAPQADGNRAAVRALEQTLLDSLRQRKEKNLSAQMINPH